MFLKNELFKTMRASEREIVRESVGHVKRD